MFNKFFYLDRQVNNLEPRLVAIQCLNVLCCICVYSVTK